MQAQEEVQAWQQQGEDQVTIVVEVLEGAAQEEEGQVLPSAEGVLERIVEEALGVDERFRLLVLALAGEDGLHRTEEEDDLDQGGTVQEGVALCPSQEVQLD